MVREDQVVLGAQAAAVVRAVVVVQEVLLAARAEAAVQGVAPDPAERVELLVAEELWAVAALSAAEVLAAAVVAI